MAFKVTARAIIPKPLNVGKMRSEIAKTLIEEGKHDRKEFNKTVEAWSSAPSMHYETKIEAKSAWVWIGPKGRLAERWDWIDRGTKDHDISARRAPRLVFPYQGKGKSYNPKTRALWLGSVSGAGQKFGPIIRPKSVHHPGIEPRYWSRTLAAQRIGPFSRNIQAAINRGLK